MAQIDTDYLIIGAGLAGLTFYHFLGSASAVVLDPHPFGFKLGESVIPEQFSHPDLRPLLDLARQLPSFSPKLGSLYIGHDSVASFPLSLADADRAMHVARDELDPLAAKLWQVPIVREKVTQIDVDRGQVTTNVHTYRVKKLIVDCSGPARLLSRSLGNDIELWPSFSSWCYFDITKKDDDAFYTWLQATQRSIKQVDPWLVRFMNAGEMPGWRPSACTTVARAGDGKFAWQIPLFDGELLSFGVTSRHKKIDRTELHAIAQQYMAPHFQVQPRSLDGNVAYDRFHTFNRFSHYAKEVAADNWLILGDSALFGEPIYATGTALAVNMAISAAALINDGGWNAAKAKVWSGLCATAREASTAARAYFFDPTAATKVSDSVGAEFDQHGLTASVFQHTMARNYATILASVKSFQSESSDFASMWQGDATSHLACLQSVQALLSTSDLGNWHLVSTANTGQGLQIHAEHPACPPLLLRIAQEQPDARCWAQEAGLGITYSNLPTGKYPLGDEAKQLLKAVLGAISLNPSAWLLAVGHQANPI